jgi:hypothetical protein
MNHSLKQKNQLQCLLTSVVILVSTSVFSQGYWWSNHVGGATAGNSDQGHAITMTESGDAIVVGFFTGTSIDFDPGPGTMTLTSGGGDPAGFIAKYDSDGQGIWASRITGSGVNIQSVKSDSSGNIYVCGQFDGAATFYTVSSTISLTGNGGADIFLAKYNVDGDALWVRGGSSPTYDSCSDIAVDDTGNVYIAMNLSSSGNINLGGTPVNVASFSTDFYLIKYNTNGNQLWYHQFSSFSSDVCTSIELDNQGHFYICGRASCDLNIDAIDTYYSSGFYLARLDLNGNFNWAINFGGSITLANDLIVDEALNIYAGGTTNNGDFNPGPGVNSLTVTGSSDAFLAKYDSSGNYVWAFAVGGTGSTSEFVQSMVLDKHGQIAVTGNFVNSADFDPGVGTNVLSTGSTWEIFLAAYDTSGNHIWAHNFGTTSGSDQGWGISLDQYENIYTTGGFLFTVDFDPGPGNGNQTSNGSSDMYYAKYCMHPPNAGDTINGNLQVCINSTNTYTVEGIDNANNYQWTLPYGCSIASGDGTSTVQILFSDSAQSGTILAEGINPCGVGSPVFLNVIVDTLPLDSPTNFVGNLIVCQGESGVIYSIDPLVGAIGYDWQFPTGGSISSGNGTVSVVADYSTLALSGNIIVSGINGCGNGTDFIQSILVNPLPAISGPITGTDRVCFDDTITFASNISDAITQAWLYSASWNVVGAADGSTINLICTEDTVLSVYGINTCGNSDTLSLNIIVDSLVPVSLDPILGQTAICSPEAGVSYSVLNLNSIADFNWSVPTDFIISSGQGTSEIFVNYFVSPTTGDIQVSGENGCGTGPVSLLNIVVNPIPPAPVITQGSDTLYSNALTGNQWYNSSGLIAGETNHWYHASSFENYYCVVTLNGCSSVSSNLITYYPIGFDEHRQYEISVFPNPANGQVFFRLNNDLTVTVIYMVDVTGRKIQIPFLISSDLFQLDLNQLSYGYYILEIMTEEGIKMNATVIIE